MGSVPVYKKTNSRNYHAPTLASNSGVLGGNIVLVNVQKKKSLCPVYSKPKKVKIYQFIPPLFPLEPVLTKVHMSHLQASWNMIEGKTAAEIFVPLGDDSRTVLVIFYDEFYKRLFHKDKKNIFREYLPNLKAKGGMISRMTKFMCAMDLSNLSILRSQLKLLGIQHTQKKIQPWMYSTLSEALVETVMFILASAANPDYYEAWRVVLSFCLHAMLPQALKNQSADFTQLEMDHARRQHHELSYDTINLPLNTGRSLCK